MLSTSATNVSMNCVLIKQLLHRKIMVSSSVGKSIYIIDYWVLMEIIARKKQAIIQISS